MLYVITTDEVKWLNGDIDRAFANGFRLNDYYLLFRSKEELLQYYTFREKYADKNTDDK